MRDRIYRDHITEYLLTEHNGKWKRHYDTYESIEWESDYTPPVKTVVETAVGVIQSAWEAKLYSRSRKEEYDALNQLELMSDDSINGTTTHKDAIVAIKAKYPKPE
jgi:deferrochelatase/peroxidase EfeB